jgi:hypothetical protein
MKRSMFMISSILMVTCILCKIYTPLEVVGAQEKAPQEPRRERQSTTQSQPAVTPVEELNRLIVMVTCKIGDQDSFGAGIIFGVSSNRLYIATANHVVRHGMEKAQNVQVQLKWMPGEWKEAALLEHTDRDLDLAVLAVDLESQRVHVDGLRWDQLGDPRSLKSGESVYSVGYPKAEPWHTYVTPDRFSKNSRDSIFFESNFIGPGNSGGALLNEGREVVGMIIEFQPPDGRAVSIQSVVDILNQWGYPVGLKQKESSNRDVDPSSPSKSLLGTWKHESQCRQPPCTFYWTFSQDGTAIFTAPRIGNQTYKYVFDGVTLRTELISDSQGVDSVMKIGDTDVYTVKFDADTMTWRHLSSGFVLVLKREH